MALLQSYFRKSMPNARQIDAIIRRLFTLTLLMALTACATTPRISFDAMDQLNAKITHFDNIRYFADDPNLEIQTFDGKNRASSNQPLRYLALSGGGADGAYGAGVLVGWTAHGDRPQFDTVTGVSAGALIAPFAFLGTEYDNDLRDVFTSGVAANLVQFKSPLRGILGQSLSHNDALYDLIDDYVDRPFLDDVAKAYRAGRQLLVITTNLDAQRSVVWNMGAIAIKQDDEAVELFRKVLVASASIPALFPAVRIEATANGNHFEELHADGGITRQVYIVPDSAFVSRSNLTPRQARKREIYVIINNQFSPHFTVVKDKTITIASRSYETLIKASTQATVNGAYELARQNNSSFYLSFIDKFYDYNQIEPFNTEYMRTLFAYGFDKGRSKAWHNKPPLGETLQ